jgi:hypothetical protein
MGIDQHELARKGWFPGDNERLLEKSIGQYLIKLSGGGSLKSVAHIWIAAENDTACRMWSTGGMGAGKSSKDYVVTDTRHNKRLCSMCLSSISKFKPVDTEDTLVVDTNP